MLEIRKDRKKWGWKKEKKRFVGQKYSLEEKKGKKGAEGRERKIRSSEKRRVEGKRMWK